MDSGDLIVYNNISFAKININILSKLPKSFTRPLYYSLQEFIITLLSLALDLLRIVAKEWLLFINMSVKVRYVLLLQAS